ncbi:MAG: hypothetical protein EOP48_00775 [Sphingobacteriales bacterium]|nr:MAG: hypothetical protein EOP48_00775 [Sphingobacteriales bacterium]
MALAVTITYAVDTVLSNSKRLIGIAQAAKAYITIEKKLVRSHKTEQAKLFSEPEPVEMAKKITSPNNKLIEDAQNEFKTVEAAIDQSDIEKLQSLSLD